MVMTHRSSTGLPSSSLNFGLLSSLLRLSSLKGNILKQIRLSTSQKDSNLLDFTQLKMILLTGTIYLNFKELIGYYRG
jgi:hypothetical protein